MQPAASPAVETPRPAATVLLLREGDAGMEVLLLRRTAQAANMPGMYVFPGGKLDAADCEACASDAHRLLDQPITAMHTSLNEPALAPAQAAGLYMAALREALEESGVLLAEARDTAAHQGIDAERARGLLDEGQSFTQVLDALHLRLQTRHIAPWTRWITPLAPSLGTRRFDTRFFVAAAPADQTARHDDGETTDSLWITPRDALLRYRDGAMDLAAPQIMSLQHLARHLSVGEVLAAARKRPPPTIQPEAFEQDGVRILCYPGDPRHPVPERAMPGPTRLRFEQRRFWPVEGGFDTLLV